MAIGSTQSNTEQQPPPALRWQPITDLPDDPRELADSELRALERVWRETCDQLDPEGLEQFNQRLIRQMAIETGVIERAYTLDRGITQLLIERGIDAAYIPRDATNKDPELVAAIIRDQHDAAEGLFAFVKRERELSTSYIKELHAALMRHQDTTTAMDSRGKLITVELKRGEWKQLPNNPVRPDGTVHEYCPPEHVDSEMDRLLEIHQSHAAAGLPPEVVAAWLHHRFAQIHPFQDGNGRVARCIATLVFIQAGWFPLSITRDDRDRYIRVLEEADSGDLKPLIALFSKRQKDAFRNALTVAEAVKKSQRVDQVIEATRVLLERRQASLRGEWATAKDTAEAVRRAAAERLEQVASRLKRELRPLGGAWRFSVDEERSSGNRGHWFRSQLIDTAKHLDYFADPASYHSWVRLIIRGASGQSEIVVSLHGIGHEFRGLLAVSAFFFRREETEKREREVVDVTPLLDEVFHINYVETADETVVRFEPWLDDALVQGLECWRTGI